MLHALEDFFVHLARGVQGHAVDVLNVGSSSPARHQGVGGRFALDEADHMARGAPPLREPLAVGSIGGERGSGNDRGKNCKDGKVKRLEREGLVHFITLISDRSA